MWLHPRRICMQFSQETICVANQMTNIKLTPSLTIRTQIIEFILYLPVTIYYRFYQFLKVGIVHWHNVGDFNDIHNPRLAACNRFIVELWVCSNVVMASSIEYTHSCTHSTQETHGCMQKGRRKRQNNVRVLR